MSWALRMQETDLTIALNLIRRGFVVPPEEVLTALLRPLIRLQVLYPSVAESVNILWPRVPRLFATGSFNRTQKLLD